mmetsp:Transcript_12426/g.40939  ORF Transcript_12426/g.40939 Transcript_12426/m.40939 type:complete len:290 (+) Transcript_12426:121-990(+)
MDFVFRRAREGRFPESRSAQIRRPREYGLLKLADHERGRGRGRRDRDRVVLGHARAFVVGCGRRGLGVASEREHGFGGPVLAVRRRERARPVRLDDDAERDEVVRFGALAGARARGGCHHRFGVEPVHALGRVVEVVGDEDDGRDLARLRPPRRRERRAAGGRLHNAVHLTSVHDSHDAKDEKENVRNPRDEQPHKTVTATEHSLFVHPNVRGRGRRRGRGANIGEVARRRDEHEAHEERLDRADAAHARIREKGAPWARRAQGNRAAKSELHDEHHHLNRPHEIPQHP